jgi:hypothetical protein
MEELVATQQQQLCHQQELQQNALSINLLKKDE